MPRNEPVTPERIEALIAALEPLDDTRLAPAKELVQVVLELHGRGLTALVNLLRSRGDDGKATLAACANDREITALLLLHDLHPDSVEVRIERALDALRRNPDAHGLTLHLRGVDDGVVTLHVSGGATRGISIPKLEAEVRAAVIELAPEVSSIEFEGLPRDGEVAFVPVAVLKSAAKHDVASAQ